MPNRANNCRRCWIVFKAVAIFIGTASSHFEWASMTTRNILPYKGPAKSMCKFFMCLPATILYAMNRGHIGGLHCWSSALGRRLWVQAPGRGSFSPVATFKPCIWQTWTCYTPACITLTDSIRAALCSSLIAIASPTSCKASGYGCLRWSHAAHRIDQWLTSSLLWHLPSSLLPLHPMPPPCFNLESCCSPC